MKNVAGDFSIPVTGFKIENSQITFRIRGLTISGNLFELLKSVDKMGDDLTWIQATGCPAFSVKNIKISSGEEPLKNAFEFLQAHFDTPRKENFYL